MRRGTGRGHGPFQVSKRAARVERAIHDESNEVKSDLQKLHALAAHVRSEAHLDEILNREDTLTPEMKDAIKKVVLPLMEQHQQERGGAPVPPVGITITDL